MISLHKGQVEKVIKHIIIDGQEWPIEREYAELGMRKGWLVRHRKKTVREGEVIWYYLYPKAHMDE